MPCIRSRRDGKYETLRLAVCAACNDYGVDASRSLRDVWWDEMVDSNALEWEILMRATTVNTKTLKVNGSNDTYFQQRLWVVTIKLARG